MEPTQPIQKQDLFSDLPAFCQNLNRIYERAIDEYHLVDSIDQQLCNPYPPGQLAHLAYLKCWIDTVQWHLEDEVRKPDIRPGFALQLKRRIDALNQERTSTVELIDGYLLDRFRAVRASPGARTNSESPAWALDRQSILALKIYHMRIETRRSDAPALHVQQCCQKLEILCEQQQDLFVSINELLQDIADGRKRMKVYKQMKMYNDPNLNPVLYNLAAPGSV